MSNNKPRTLPEEVKSSMLTAIEDFFEKNVFPPEDDALTTDRRLQMATAVLLLEMSRADLEVTLNERIAVSQAIERALGLNQDETARIVRLAEGGVRQSAPLHAFTKLIDRNFNAAQKKRVVELLWRVAYSDAKLDGHEEYLVRKVSEQLHVPLADFLDAKIKARDDFLGNK